MPASSVRPKRAAEENAQTNHDDLNGQPSKKPRFDVRNPSALAPDELEDDATLEADVIGSRGQQVRRGAVNVDGYDSDSDNENFNARADAKAREKKAQSRDEEDSDMFADLAEDLKDGDNSEGDTGRRDGKKKAVRFLDENEIEGQIKNSKSGGHVSADFTLNGRANGNGAATWDSQSESSSDSEVDDETRASAGEVDKEIGAGGKKFHAPKLDAFNMRTEQEEGRFDDQGNFVRKAADPDAIHDIWMEGVSRKEMKKAKDAARKREEDQRQRDLQDEAKSAADILKTLIPLLERGETVLEALARLGKGKGKKPKWQTKNKNKRPRDAAQCEEMTESDSVKAKRLQDIEAITAAADLLLIRGQPEIYDAERELLIRQYVRESGQQWTDPSEDTDCGRKLWEYRWTDARDGGQVNGPYDSETMRQWNEAGYFGEGVEFRQSGEITWSRIVDLK